MLFESENYYNYDLRDHPRKISNPDRSNLTTQMVDRPEEEWKHIPHHATQLRVKTVNRPQPSPHVSQQAPQPPAPPQAHQQKYKPQPNNMNSQVMFKRLR